MIHHGPQENIKKNSAYSGKTLQTHELQHFVGVPRQEASHPLEVSKIVTYTIEPDSSFTLMRIVDMDVGRSPSWELGSAQQLPLGGVWYSCKEGDFEFQRASVFLELARAF